MTPEQRLHRTGQTRAFDGKHYWNCWTRNYQSARDGYCIHAFCEEDRTEKTLCGVVATEGGGQSFPHDENQPSCLKCRRIMFKRGALKIIPVAPVS